MICFRRFGSSTLSGPFPSLVCQMVLFGVTVSDQLRAEGHRIGKHQSWADIADEEDNRVVPDDVNPWASMEGCYTIDIFMFDVDVDATEQPEPEPAPPAPRVPELPVPCVHTKRSVEYFDLTVNDSDESDESDVEVPIQRRAPDRRWRVTRAPRVFRRRASGTGWMTFWADAPDFDDGRSG